MAMGSMDTAMLLCADCPCQSDSTRTLSQDTFWSIQLFCFLKEQLTGQVEIDDEWDAAGCKGQIRNV